MHKNQSIRNITLGFMGMLIVVTLFMAGPSSLMADDFAPIGTADQCVYLPVVMGASGPGGAGGNFLPDCLGAGKEAELVDFNGDGYGDQAIGIPGDNAANLTPNSGAVNVLYGTSSGLSATDSQLITQAFVGGEVLADERFGRALSPGDFNDDGYTDLAVGSPGEDDNGTNSVGQVDVIYGSSSGLASKGAQVLSQVNPKITGAAEANDMFGEALESGDFNDDGYTDLAVGIPHEDFEGGPVIDNMGAITIFYGSDSGLRTDNELLIYPALPTVSGTAVDQGLFGTALVAANFDDDEYEDLAVGIPGYDIVGKDGVGAVEVFNGSANGVSLIGETLWRQGFNGVQGNPETGDGFGQALTAGDFDKNDVADLVVGVPGENVEQGGDDFADAGAFHVIYGYKNGLSGSGDQIFHQGQADVLGEAENGDLFGSALASRDFNGDGADDLAVSAPGQANAAVLQGQVIAFYSNGAILSHENQDLFMQGIVQGAPEAGDFFGFSLGTADYDNNGIADLAIGSPFEDVPFGGGPQIVDAGSVNIVYGQDTGLGITDNQIWGRHIGGIEKDPEALDFYGWALTQ